MSEHKAFLNWTRKTADFNYETYDRTHEVHFEGGTTFKASSAPDFLGKKENVNPEEMLAASLASCHMLTFLAIAAKSRLILESYQDEATSILEKNEKGKLAVTKIFLKPRAKFSGESRPNLEKIKEMHSKAHHNCFIANSIKCDVTIEPVEWTKEDYEKSKDKF